MDVIYNGKTIKVQVAFSAPGVVAYFYDEDRTYYASEVVYKKEDLPAWT